MDVTDGPGDGATNPAAMQARGAEAVSNGQPPRPAVVAVMATKPETVTEDIQRAMELAGVGQHLDPLARTLLKINISWQHWYPWLFHQSLAVGWGDQGVEEPGIPGPDGGP